MGTAAIRPPTIPVEVPTMRIRFAPLALALALVPFASAGAGEVTGCDCNNMCPLAQEANKHRSTGEEAVATSALARADYVRAVKKALATI
jgi:hypothetical protein